MPAEQFGNNPEISEELTPKLAELIGVCKGLLETEDLEFMYEIDDFEAALDYAYGKLHENGYDPDEVLTQATIIEETE